MSAELQIAQIIEQIDALSGAVNLVHEHLAVLLALPEQVEDLRIQVSQAATMLTTIAGGQETTETQLAAVDECTQHLTPAFITVQEAAPSRAWVVGLLPYWCVSAHVGCQEMAFLERPLFPICHISYMLCYALALLSI